VGIETEPEETMKSILIALFIALSLATTPALAQKKGKKAKLEAGGSTENRNVEYLSREIRKELVTLPFFGVFDWLEGSIEPDGTVTLRGEVTRPTTKSDAKRRVEKIEGVETVINKIEVLPLSNFDEQLRRRVFRTLFNQGSPLFRYGQGVNPSIHILIKNGRLTLKGVVSNRGDSDLANVLARGVEGLFEVKNELRVEK
jgi:hyperosmotically inducible periplasmic protein